MFWSCLFVVASFPFIFYFFSLKKKPRRRCSLLCSSSSGEELSEELQALQQPQEDLCFLSVALVLALAGLISIPLTFYLDGRIALCTLGCLVGLCFLAHVVKDRQLSQGFYRKFWCEPTIPRTVDRCAYVKWDSAGGGDTRAEDVPQKKSTKRPEHWT